MRLLYILIGLFFSMCLDAQTNGSKIVSEELRFQIEFPIAPNNRQDSVIKLGYLYKSDNWDILVDDEKHPNSYYAIAVTLFDPKDMHTDSSFAQIEKLLDQPIQSFASSGAFDILSSSFDFIQDYPGKVFKLIRKNDGALLEFRSYLFYNVLYEITVVTKPNAMVGNTASKFFDSFKLINAKDNHSSYDFERIKEKSYEITFPEKPRVVNQIIQSRYGKLNTEVHVFRPVEGPNVAFIATETKYPKQLSLTDEELDAFYATSIDEALKSSNGTLINKKPLLYNGKHEGMEFEYTILEGHVKSYNKTLFVDGTLYTWGIFYKLYNLEVDNFIESFKLK